MAQVYKIDQKRYEFKEIDSLVQTSFAIQEEDYNKWLKVKTDDNSVDVQLPNGLSQGFRCIIENTGVFTVNYINASGTTIATQQDKFTEDQFRTVEVVYDNSVWRIQGYIGRQDLSSLYDVNVNASGLPAEGDALVYDINSNIWQTGKKVPFIPADPIFQDYIIVNEDHSKILLFDTTANPITVIFNLGLEEGLLVKVVNIGSGTLTISTAGTLISSVTTLASYQNMEVLHAASNIFYGVVSGSQSINTGGLKVIAEVNVSSTAQDTFLIPVNTINNALTVVPPSSPIVNTIFGVVDSRGNASTNNITIDFTTAGQNLYGTLQNYVLDIDSAFVSFIYVSAAVGWVKSN